MVNYYELKLENDTLLQIPEFVKFCVDHQHKNIIVQVNNEGHCLRHCKVYDILDMFQFSSVELQTWNILENHNVYNINTNNWNWWLKNFKKFDFKFDYSWTGKKLFGCFYGRPSAPRLGIAAHLVKYHSENSIIKTKFDFSTEDSRKLFDLQKLFSWNPNAIEYVNKFQKTKYSSEDYIRGQWKTDNPLSYLYKDLLIDIISEPTCHGITFYPTEKIVRAMLCKRPFIAMCSKNYLIYLRQMGFKTFYEFWSEDYDGYSGKEKYFHILELIDRVAKMPHNDLIVMYKEMQKILEHNRNLIITQTYKKTVNKVD